MRNTMCAVIIVMAISLAGCAEKRKASREANQLSAAYEVQMDQGKTTPDQDKRFIKAMSKVTLELDSAIRGTEKAAKSRKDAINAATLGVDPNAIPTINK